MKKDTHTTQARRTQSRKPARGVRPRPTLREDTTIHPLSGGYGYSFDTETQRATLHDYAKTNGVPSQTIVETGSLAAPTRVAPKPPPPTDRIMKATEYASRIVERLREVTDALEARADALTGKDPSSQGRIYYSFEITAQPPAAEDSILAALQGKLDKLSSAVARLSAVATRLNEL